MGRNYGAGEHGGKFDRTPPQNIEAERGVLGAMLLNPDAVGVGLEILAGAGTGDEVFYLECHGLIFDAIKALFLKGVPIDAVILMDELGRAGVLEKAGGASYLAELTRAVPTSANVEYYAQIVCDCALLRVVIQEGTRLVSEAYAGEVVAGDLVSRAGAAFLRMGLYGRGDVGRRLEELGEEARRRFFARQRGELLGIGTGFADLDKLLGGFRKQELTVLGARPSVGKTSLLLEFGIAAARAGARVLIQSLEQSEGALYDRMVYAVAGLNGRALASPGTLTARQDGERFDRAQVELAGLPIWIEEGVALSPSRMMAGARRRKAREGLDLYLLDYLQLMGVDGRANSRHEAIGAAAIGCKQVARECDCHVVVASQLARAAEQHAEGRPRMCHLRESGDIEAAADNIGLLSRVIEGGKPAVDESGFGQVMLLDLTKQREGPTGEVYVVADRRTGRWRGVSAVSDGEGATPHRREERQDARNGAGAQGSRGGYSQEVLAGAEYGWVEDEVEFD